MLEKHLHIITLDVPYPADYGGVVDLFYKLKALHQQGIRIHLHCFTNGRAEQEELTKYCVEVNYYQRKKGLAAFSFSIPFMVRSRNSKRLTERLKEDDYPVLMEGMHCTFPLFKGELGGRNNFVRLHNTEFQYYGQLAKSESNLLKKIYFLYESRLLRSYEKRIAGMATLIAVSEKEANFFHETFHAPRVHYMPVFVPWTMAAGKEGSGCFCLYHGNLSINENEKAAEWLLKNIFSKLKHPLVIAGKRPSAKLENMVHQYMNTCIVADPSEKEMQDLIAKAHINILPAFNNAGIKLKVLNAVFSGKHCLVNDASLPGGGTGKACVVANTADEFKEAVVKLYEEPFSHDEVEQRQGLLQREFNNEENARKLITWIW